MPWDVDRAEYQGFGRRNVAVKALNELRRPTFLSLAGKILVVGGLNVTVDCT